MVRLHLDGAISASRSFVNVSWFESVLCADGIGNNAGGLAWMDGFEREERNENNRVALLANLVP